MPAYRKICVVGPGAIGGTLAALLANNSIEVTALARPEREARINKQGITLLMGGKTIKAHPRAASHAQYLGPQDLVLVTLKSNNLQEVASDLAHLCGPHTQIIFLMNGVPWWFLDGLAGPYNGAALSSVDPGGLLARTIPLARVIWGVIELAVHELPDGTVKHSQSSRIVLGRPDDTLDQLDDIAQIFRAVGFDVTATNRIRAAIWNKLISNASLNPMSALALTPGGEIFDDPLLRDLMLTIIAEVQAVGLALGLGSSEMAKRLAAMTLADGNYKPSMLQDMERGRPLELDALVAAPVEIARIVGVDVPMTRAVLGLLRARLKAEAIA